MLAEDDFDSDSDETSEIQARDFAIIILAAGSSSRMGSPKQLLEINGEPLLLHTVNVALGANASEVVLVLGSNEQAHAKVISDKPIATVTNHYWRGGMGSSLKTGLQHLIKLRPETEAVLIMVCDQPAIRPEHLQALMTTFIRSKKAIVAAAYANTVGVPVMFSRSFFSNILMLQDDQGAKKIIGQFPEQVEMVDMPEAIIDLDTKEDYEKFRGRQEELRA